MDQFRTVIALITLACVGVCILLLETSCKADPGNYSLSSPFGCGEQCHDGYELSGHTTEECTADAIPCYNTVDACADGSKFTFEYVHDLYVLDLNQSTFLTGDQIEITGEFDCDADGDAVSLAYSNGSAWQNVYNNTCNVSQKVNYSVNIVLDNVEGNHSVRAVIIWDGAPGAVCGHDQDPDYSDTDDLSFYVQFPGDTIPPVSSQLSPPNASELESSQYPNVTLSLLVTDNTAVGTVIADIAWGAQHETLSLADPDNDHNYTGVFLNTSYLGRYNVTIYANDTAGNTATLTGYFFINQTTNITVQNPLPGARVLPSLLIAFTLLGNYTPAWTGYALDSEDNTTIQTSYNLTIGDREWSSGSNLTAYASLNQSFMPERDMTVREMAIALQRTGSGAENVSLCLYNGTTAPQTALACANISNETVPLSLTSLSLQFNDRVQLYNQTPYWLLLSGNGTATDTLSWLWGPDAYGNGNASADPSYDQFAVLYDSQYYEIPATLTKGSHTLVVFANTSVSTIRSPATVFVVDDQGPQFYNLSYQPDTAADLDPGNLITVRINASDLMDVDTLFLQSRMSNDSIWNNHTMLLTTSWQGNFTPDTEANWTFRVWGNDTAGNENATAASSLPVFYERSWIWTPASLNTTGGALSTNISLANLTLNNTGDANLTLSINKSANTVLPMFFNTSPILLGIGESATVAVIVTTLEISGQSPVSIILNSSDPTITPANLQLNTTVVSNNSGTHLVIEFQEYDSDVVQGQTRAAYTAKVTNVGLAEATDAWINWTVPEGWTNKTALHTLLGNLSFGESTTSSALYDIGSTAPLGSVILVVAVNSSQDSSAYDTRNVTVTAAASSLPESGGTRTVSSSPSAPPTIMVLEQAPLLLAVPSLLTGTRGTTVAFAFNITNPSASPYADLIITLEGIPSGRVTLDPAGLASLDGHATAQGKAILETPYYWQSGSHALMLRVQASGSRGPVTVEHEIELVLSTTGQQETATCLSNAEEQIAVLTDDGYPTERLLSKLLDAKQAYALQQYDAAGAGCAGILEEVTAGQQVKDLLDAWDSPDNLEDSAFLQLQDARESVRTAWQQGDFSLAGSRAADVTALLTAKQLEQAASMDTFRRTGTLIGWVVGILLLAGLALAKPSRSWWLHQQTHRLKQRSQVLLDFKADLARLHYKEHVLSQREYQEFVQHVTRRLANDQVSLLKADLGLLRLKHNNAKTVYALRKAIMVALRNLQQNYYQDHTLSSDQYGALHRRFQELLNDLPETRGDDA